MTFIICLLILLPTGVLADEKEIHKLLSLPEKKIDMGKAALILAKDIFPSLDIRAYSLKIEALAQKALLFTRGSTDPDYRIRALNTFLFREEGFKYDLSDPFAENPKNRYLNGILETKKGSCVTMPLLYMVVAQRLGYPVYMVTIPDHYFLRYVDPKLKEQNIEATSGGGYSSDKQYIKDFQIPARAIDNGAFLKTMTNRELIATLVTQNAISHARKKNLPQAIRYLEHALKVYPRSCVIHEIFGCTYLSYSQILNGEESKQYYEKGILHRKKADDLGFLRLSREEYAKQVADKARAESSAHKGDKQ